MRELISFILDILTPQPLLVAGFNRFSPASRDEKPKRSLAEIFGLSVNKGGGGGTPYIPDPPAPPVINIPPAPVAPIPPPPTSSQSIYNADRSANEAAAQQAAGFGYQASLLSLPISGVKPSGTGGSSGGTGPNGTVNTATGTGSLLGLK